MRKIIFISTLLLTCNISTAYATKIGGYTISQPQGLKTDFTTPGALAYTVSRTFLFIIALMGTIGIIFFLWSGFQYLTSKGDPKALDAAKHRLTYTIVGLVIIFLAYSLTNYVSGLFGLATP